MPRHYQAYEADSDEAITASTASKETLEGKLAIEPCGLIGSRLEFDHHNSAYIIHSTPERDIETNYSLMIEDENTVSELTRRFTTPATIMEMTIYLVHRGAAFRTIQKIRDGERIAYSRNPRVYGLGSRPANYSGDLHDYVGYENTVS